MSEQYFPSISGWISEYPADFIPKGGVEFVGIDYARDGSDCTVKGFFKDGIYHIQSVDYREAMKDE